MADLQEIIKVECQWCGKIMTLPIDIQYGFHAACYEDMCEYDQAKTAGEYDVSRSIELNY